MHLNPEAPHYFPPPPPPPPPYIPWYPYLIPPCPPLPIHPFAVSALPAFPETHPNARKEKKLVEFRTTHPNARKERPVWVPKKHFTSARKFLSATPVAPPPRATVSTYLDFDSAAPELLAKGTTIMIKNIPNKMTREMLIEMLDQLCAEQETRMEKDFVKSEYDFVYLPIDFSTRANKGYAFVNFTMVQAAKNAYEEMHYRKWIVFRSKKVARICFARVQGKDALVNRFRCTEFRCDTDEFLPAVFTPPRNGTTSLSSPNSIGIRPIHSR